MIWVVDESVVVIFIVLVLVFGSDGGDEVEISLLLEFFIGVKF